MSNYKKSLWKKTIPVDEMLSILHQSILHLRTEEEVQLLLKEIEAMPELTEEEKLAKQKRIARISVEENQKAGANFATEKYIEFIKAKLSQAYEEEK